MLLVWFATSPIAAAQEPPESEVPQAQIVHPLNASCIEPAPMVRLSDYRGPLQKTVGILARKVERRSATAPRYRTDLALCTLGAKDKFLLFVHDTFEPLSFISAAFDSGLGQTQNEDPSFGQGSLGYGKRFATNFAGQSTGRFFKQFLYPTIFKEDPRYYPLGQGSTGARLLHAMGHTVIAHRDSGKQMFNFSEWLGTASSVALINAYHPGSDRGSGAVAREVSYSVLTDLGFDLLREFWPEIARKFKLPFRELKEAVPVQPPR